MITLREDMEDTLPKLLRRNYIKYGNRKAAMRKKAFGVWNEYTWTDYYEKAKFFGLGLLSLGLERGDRVCIIGNNGPEWYWADIGTQAVGGVPVGVFTECGITEVKYIMDNSESKFAVARDQEQVDKFLAIKQELPGLQKVIYWDRKGLWSYNDNILIMYEEILKLGQHYEKDNPDKFEQAIVSGNASDPAFLAYTSGTTGLPKGVLVTQTNLLTMADNWITLHPHKDSEQYVSLVAPAWIAEQWYGIAIPLSASMTVNFTESNETADSDKREIAPHLIGLPPWAWEAIASKIQATIMNSGILNRMAYGLFLPVGYRIADFHYEKKRPNLFWEALHGVAHLIIFRPLLDKLGLPKVRVAVTSGGFLAPDVFHYLRALGINLKQGYGLTEAGLVAFHRDDDIHYETVGQLMPNVELRIADDGELLSRSSMVISGYWRNPRASEEKLKGGWVQMGDAGYFNDDGHLFLLDRLTDLVDLPTGGKFSPSHVEGRLRFSPFIKSVMVVGGGEYQYITAIVSIDFEVVSQWAEKNRIPFTTSVDLSQKAEVSNLIKLDVQRVNIGMNEACRIKKFVILHKEMDADDAELTRTKKLRRSHTQIQYKELIEAMYTERKKFDVEAKVRYRDGRMGVVSSAIEITMLD